MRKPYLTLSAELDVCFKGAATRIVDEVEKRARGELEGGGLAYETSPASSGSGGRGNTNMVGEPWLLGERIRAAVKKWAGRA